MFWFNKQYSIQRTDYNIGVHLIIIFGSQLPDSYSAAPPLILSAASALTLSDFSTNTVYDFSTNSVSNIPLSFFAPPRMCSANTRGQGHVGLFYETIYLKGPTIHWWTRRRLGSRDIVYDSTDILGLFVHDTTYVWYVLFVQIYWFDLICRVFLFRL